MNEFVKQLLVANMFMATIFLGLNLVLYIVGICTIIYCWWNDYKDK